MSIALEILPNIYPVFFIALAVGIFNVWKWAVWLAVSFLIAIIKSLIGLYQACRIVLDLVVLVILKFIVKLIKFGNWVFSVGGEMKWRRRMKSAETYRDWYCCAQKVDEIEGNLKWKEIDDDVTMLPKLIATTEMLRAHREKGDCTSLLYELPGIVKRNHLGIDDHELHARCLTGTKASVERFCEEVITCLEYIKGCSREQVPVKTKIAFFQKLSKNLGHTALCLSGGGSLSMYHMGVIRALIESGSYEKIRVVSGASGGSIPVAMCATRTEQQLLDDVLVDDVSTDFKRTGDMARNRIVWFPPLWKQALNFIKTGFLVDNREYQRTCEFYWGDITFQEAYEITHKHVCISVTSASSGGSGPTKLLLNHVSTPHVLIRSAVAASCALPGIMAPNRLLCKASDGRIVDFEVDGVDFIDGSVQADVPFRRMSALFSVSNFIVSQVNVHVLPFIEHKIPGALPSNATVLRSMLKALDLDLRHRSLILATMGLLPKFYGTDISSLFKQRYHGDVTIVPDMRVEESLGVKAIIHPSRVDMKSYIRGGRKASWPHLRRVKHLLMVEARIWNLLEELIADENLSLPSPLTPLNATSTTLVDADSLTSSEGDGAGDEEQEQASSDVSDESLTRRRSLSHEVSVSNLLLYSTSAGNAVAPTGQGVKHENGATMAALNNRIRELEQENIRLRKKVLEAGGML